MRGVELDLPESYGLSSALANLLIPAMRKFAIEYGRVPRTVYTGTSSKLTAILSQPEYNYDHINTTTLIRAKLVRKIHADLYLNLLGTDDLEKAELILEAGKDLQMQFIPVLGTVEAQSGQSYTAIYGDSGQFLRWEEAGKL